VGHLDENTIVAFFSAERAPALVARIEAHAAECERCRTLLAEYAAIARTEKPVVTERLASAANPQADGEADAVELVHRLALAQATKRIGTIVKEKWEIEALLGTGGMSLVYAARHRNGRRVALKFMRPELAVERSLVERFLREGYVANKIDHPNAVAILDDDVAEDGAPFLVMELLAGETLRGRLGRGPLPTPDALRATNEVLDVLAVAHDKGIVHRDLKPDNLFATEAGPIKILDFGIARLRERSARDVETRSGVTMGTLGFMPPEQARGLTAEIDARSDVWAVGATLYTLLTGRSLHEAATPNESLLLAMTKPAPPMSDALPSVPRPVQSVIDRALSFEKELRYANAREMKAALEEAMRGNADPDARTPAPSRSGLRLVVATGGLVGAAAVAFFAWRSLAGHSERPVGLVLPPADVPPSMSSATVSPASAPIGSAPIASTAPAASSAPAGSSRVRLNPAIKTTTTKPAASPASEPPDPLGPRH
jgi:eukaryotic-like serine/threonine-protein kinase